MRRSWQFVLVSITVVALPAGQVVAGPASGDDVVITSALVTWPAEPGRSMRLSISGPDGLHLDRSFGVGEPASLGLFCADGAILPDGIYMWETVTVGPLPEAKQGRTQEDDIRQGEWSSSKTPEDGVPRKRWGYLRIRGGSFLVASGLEQAVAAGPGEGVPEPATADQVVNEDLIVVGSLCAGADCVDGEVFGQDDLKIRERNVRLLFADRTGDPAWPLNDWRIVINDEAEGGADYFAVEDVDGGTVPLKISAGAPDNTLYVGSNGKIGLGTVTPSQEIEIKTDLPGIRLFHDGDPDWQSFDVGLQSGYFFIKDLRYSAVPFSIEPGTPSETLRLSASGQVGIGTFYPKAPLDITQTGRDARINLRRTDGTANFLASTTGGFEIGSGYLTSLTLTEPLDASGPTLEVTGTVAGTQFAASSSRKLKTDFEVVDAHAVLVSLTTMPVESWRYLWDDASARHIGPTAEDFQAALGLGDGERISGVDASGVALAAIQELHRLLLEKDRQLAELRARVETLEESR